MDTALERVTEYLRQFSKLQDTGGIIHGVHTNPEAERVVLTFDDLKQALLILDRYQLERDQACGERDAAFAVIQESGPKNEYGMHRNIQ